MADPTLVDELGMRKAASGFPIGPPVLMHDDNGALAMVEVTDHLAPASERMVGGARSNVFDLWTELARLHPFKVTPVVEEGVHLGLCVILDRSGHD